MEEDFYIHLIYKKLAGELSVEEERQLNTWLEAAADHRQTAAAVEKAWNVSDLLQPKAEVNLDEEFSHLEQLMQDDAPKEMPKETPVKPLTPIPRRSVNWLGIAAGVAMLVAAIFLLKDQVGSPSVASSELVTVQSDQRSEAINLADGTKIFLNKNSELTYPKELNGAKRTVKLEGEAYFEVAHRPEQPFEVMTASEKVTVLGTSFTVKTGSDTPTTVYVATGKVQLEQTTSREKIILTKGEKGISDISNNQLQETSGTPNELAWHTRKLVFVETPVAEMLPVIEEVYGVTVIAEREELKNCLFTATFEEEPLETIWETMSTVLGLDIDKNPSNKSYILKGGSCE